MALVDYDLGASKIAAALGQAIRIGFTVVVLVIARGDGVPGVAIGVRVNRPTVGPVGGGNVVQVALLIGGSRSADHLTRRWSMAACVSTLAAVDNGFGLCDGHSTTGHGAAHRLDGREAQRGRRRDRAAAAGDIR